MKILIKIMIIFLGMVISFFPVHPAEKYKSNIIDKGTISNDLMELMLYREFNEEVLATRNSSDCCEVSMKWLDGIEEEFDFAYNVTESVIESLDYLRISAAAEIVKKQFDCANNWRNFVESDDGLSLSLDAAKLIRRRNWRKEKEKILKKSYETVKRGGSLVSGYNIVSRGGEGEISVSVSPSEKPISVFTLVERLVENPPLTSYVYDGSDVSKKKLWMIKRQWMEAVFRGYYERQGTSICDDELMAFVLKKFQMEIPNKLMSLIFSFLSEHCTNAESTKLIKQAEEKLAEEQQLQSDLDEEMD